MKILIIEDEKIIREELQELLLKNGYEVFLLTDFTNVLPIDPDKYDLILLDINLPNLNGEFLLKEIRKTSNIPIIMLTSRVDEMDEVLSITNGADDYISKPFHIEELIARVNVQLRKNSHDVSREYLEVGDLRLYIKTSKLFCITTKEEINICCKEYLLMEYLMSNPKQIISRDQLYDKVWGINNEIESNNLEAYLSFLRKKIKIIGSTITIKAIRGLGYKLEV